ncbi:MAG: hypothetical protein U9R03_01435 [Candidatus Aerophobetes bacterium]|nr:hypothetical protein [Candidatus Aerophobetes bacterium]
MSNNDEIVVLTKETLIQLLITVGIPEKRARKLFDLVIESKREFNDKLTDDQRREILEAIGTFKKYSGDFEVFKEEPRGIHETDLKKTEIPPHILNDPRVQGLIEQIEREEKTWAEAIAINELVFGPAI